MHSRPGSSTICAQYSVEELGAGLADEDPEALASEESSRTLSGGATVCEEAAVLITVYLAFPTWTQ